MLKSSGTLPDRLAVLDGIFPGSPASAGRISVWCVGLAITLGVVDPDLQRDYRPATGTAPEVDRWRKPPLGDAPIQRGTAE